MRERRKIRVTFSTKQNRKVSRQSKCCFEFSNFALSQLSLSWYCFIELLRSIRSKIKSNWYNSRKKEKKTLTFIINFCDWSKYDLNKIRCIFTLFKTFLQCLNIQRFHIYERKNQIRYFMNLSRKSTRNFKSHSLDRNNSMIAKMWKIIEHEKRMIDHLCK